MIRHLILLLTLTFPAFAWSLEAAGGWMRALPPGQPTAAAYMILSNPGSEPVTVTGASTVLADRVEIHQSSQVDGMWRMSRMEQLEIAPGASVELAPGGIHLMLFGLKGSPREGDSVSFKLELAGGESLPVTVKVLAPGAGSPGGHDHHHH